MYQQSESIKEQFYDELAKICVLIQKHDVSFADVIAKVRRKFPKQNIYDIRSVRKKERKQQNKMSKKKIG